MNRRVFRGMGCEIIAAGTDRSEFDAIVRLFEERDATFSRFRAESELSRVNASSAPALLVSELFAEAVSAALWAARVTDGEVDPTLGAAVEAAGYNADFGELIPDPRPLEPVQRTDWRTIRVVGPLLFRPPGTELDLNGVVKAMTVDAAAGLLSGPGFVSAGGDIATRGSSVTVALPGGDAVTLTSGGIATSGTATRRWLRGGTVQHHLIDPITGRPSDSPWTYVTAVGRNCLNADVAAKAGFLLGDRGPAWLDARGVAARFVAAQEIVANNYWKQSLEREIAWA